MSDSAGFFDSNFWAAIVGAIVGGVFSVGLQAYNFYHGQKKTNRALGYSLLFKLMTIHTHQSHFLKHINNMKQHDPDVEHPARWLLPIANVPHRIEFSSDEMAMLLSLKNNDVFNKIASLDGVYNSILPVWSLYQAVRTELGNLNTKGLNHQTGEGFIALTKDSPEEVKFFEVNHLASQLISRASEDEKEARQGLIEAAKVLESNLGIKAKLEFRD